jgi:hypothetical protein
MFAARKQDDARTEEGESGVRRPSESFGATVKIGAQLSSPVRRVLAVAGLAALAGLAAFVVKSDDPKTYERQSSFAIRPSETVAAGSLSDVVGTLAQSDSAVTETIVDMLGSGRLRATAAQAAGLPPGSVGESGTPYVWTATRRPGSAIVDIKLTGPSDAKLLAMQAATPGAAASLVGGSYSLYRLESLSAPTSSPDQVGPKTKQTVALAVILGALVGVALILIEVRLLSSPGMRTVDRGGDGRPKDTDDLSGETDRLESTLRESLGNGASVRRVGPGRIEVAHPEAAPDRETRRRRR